MTEIIVISCDEHVFMYFDDVWSMNIVYMMLLAAVGLLPLRCVNRRDQASHA